jgi:hypothetical protein
MVALAAAGANAQSTPLADPMRPPNRAPETASGTLSALRLEGILVSGSRKLALIGGEFLEEGERIHGVHIVRIERETVTVRRDGQTFVLRPESAVAQSAAESGEPQ